MDAYIYTDHCRALYDFDAALVIGQRVEVRWRLLHTHEAFAAPGHIKHVHSRTVIVTLEADVCTSAGEVYRSGHTIYAPRRTSKLWTMEDCVLPLSPQPSCHGG